MTYNFNKYNKKVRPISYTYINHINAINSNYNYSLFVINTGGYDYEPMTFKKARIVMEKIFPEPTPYEITNYSYFPSFTFDVVCELDKKITELEKNDTKKNEKMKSYEKEVKEKEKKIKENENIILENKNKIQEYENKIQEYENKIQKEEELINKNKNMKKSKNILIIICIIEAILLIMPLIILIYIYRKRYNTNLQKYIKLINSKESNVEKKEKQKEKINQFQLMDIN